MNHVNIIRKAKKYTDRGWKVFPIIPNGKLPKIKSWQQEATTDDKKIVLWWKFQFKDANIGIVTGAASENLVVLDVDVKDGKQGLESLKALTGGGIPETYTVQTPSGGYHFYFISNTHYGNSVGFRPGLDLRGDGGYVVAPPSVIDGKEYDAAASSDFPSGSH